MYRTAAILAFVLVTHASVTACGRSTPPSAATPAAAVPRQVDAQGDAMACVLVDETGAVLNDKMDESALRSLLGQRISLRGGVSRTKPGDFMGCTNAEVEVHVVEPIQNPMIATGTLVLVWDAHYYKSANEGKTRREEMVQDYGSHWAVARFELKPE